MSDIEQSEYGNIIKVLYLTKEFSPNIKKLITSNITPSMISDDGSSSQYLLDYVRDLISEESLTKRDLSIIEYCAQNEIEYVEF